MSFLLTGFRQISGFRQYAFRSTGTAPENFTVRTDLNLVRKHNIPMQELPLLCRRLLEEADAPLKSHGLVFTEEAMLGYVKSRARAEEDAALKRKKHRIPVSQRVGVAWRARGRPPGEKGNP